MSLDNETVNIYSGGLTGGSSYTIIPNSYKIYVIPSTGVTAAFDIILPKLYDNSIDISSFRIINYSSFDIKLKYIANATDDATGDPTSSLNPHAGGTGTLTIFTTLKSKSSIIIDGINQAYNILDISNIYIDSNTGEQYLLLSGGTINGNLTVSAKSAGSNYGPTMIIDGSSIRSHGKVSLNGTVVSATLSEPISDLDIYQSANLDLSSNNKTAGIRLYGFSEGDVEKTNYILGVNRAGGLSLFKKNADGYVDLVCTFDEDGIETTIKPTLYTHLVNKVYVDTRYVVPPITFVPNLTSNFTKNWSVIVSNELVGWEGFNVFNNNPGSAWYIDGASTGSIASLAIGTDFDVRYILGGFGISSKSIIPPNTFPNSWTISGGNSSDGPLTTLYTGTSSLTDSFTTFFIDFRSIVDSNRNPAAFRIFRFSGRAGGVGSWGISRLELYAAVPIR